MNMKSKLTKFMVGTALVASLGGTLGAIGAVQANSEPVQAIGRYYHTLFYKRIGNKTYQRNVMIDTFTGIVYYKTGWYYVQG